MKEFSYATFGSHTRGDHDKLSDNDVLVVSNTVKLLNDFQLKFHGSELSLSTYTYRKLDYMASKGSLFVQHLKQESSIEYDHIGKLKQLLDDFKPLKSYSSELKKALSFFDFFELLPKSVYLSGWLIDCLYITFRNFLIIQSANSGDFQFSYKKLITQWLKGNPESNFTGELLLDLRLRKSRYRSRSSFLQSFDSSQNKKYFELIKFISGINPTFCEVNEYNQYALAILNSPKVAHFKKVKVFELYCLVNGFVSPDIQKVIYKPQAYSMLFNNSTFIDELLSTAQQISHNEPNMIYLTA